MMISAEDRQQTAPVKAIKPKQFYQESKILTNSSIGFSVPIVLSRWWPYHISFWIREALQTP